MDGLPPAVGASMLAKCQRSVRWGKSVFLSQKPWFSLACALPAMWAGAVQVGQRPWGLGMFASRHTVT